MNSSINELAALARKAARGAGYSWSMADEAAYATAWLCRNGIDGAAALASHLECISIKGAENVQLQSLTFPLQGASKGLCAMSAGASLSDLAGSQFAKNRSGKLINLITPVLTLPYFAYVVERQAASSATDATQNHTINIDCKVFAAKISTIENRARLTAFKVKDEASDLFDSQNTVDLSYEYEISPTENSAKLEPLRYRVMLDANTINTLDGFASNTYAPATDASRAGAGAGNTDND